MPEYDVIDFARTQLTLPDRLDPADEMSWQHYLYSKLGKKEEVPIQELVEKSTAEKKGEEKRIEETVERIVAMAKVLYGLHMVSDSLNIELKFPYTQNYLEIWWREEFNILYISVITFRDQM